MAQVITFEGFQPIPRYDGTAFTQARIEEASAATGPWTGIETISLSPVDSDPSSPATRNLTTDSASDTTGLWYRVVFIDGTGDESAPTDPISNPSSTTYATRTELKSWLGITGTSQDGELDDALESASRVIDIYKGTRFYPVTETRYYSPHTWDESITVDDLNTAGTVSVDTSGDYTYGTTWTANTHFILEPVNAPLTGSPYDTLRLLPQSGVAFTGYLKGLRITGSFGWAAAPAQVKQACKMLAGRYYNRRNTPLGIMSVGAGDAALHLARTDPDVAQILDNIDGSQAQLIA